MTPISAGVSKGETMTQEQQQWFKDNGFAIAKLKKDKSKQFLIVKPQEYRIIIFHSGLWAIGMHKIKRLRPITFEEIKMREEDPPPYS